MSYYYLDELVRRRPELTCIIPDIENACELIISAYRNGNKVLVCGNGGSCADADHIVGELMKGFMKKRPLSNELNSRFAALGGSPLAEKLQTPLRAISLCSHPALSTAFANDVEPDYVFAQLALAYSDPGDIFIGISTSGNARNVHYAAVTAKVMRAKLIGLSGSDGGKMRESGLYDTIISAPESVTYRAQEAHIAIYHAICLTVEDKLFCDEGKFPVA